MYIAKDGTAVPHIDVGEKRKLRVAQWMPRNHGKVIQLIGFSCLTELELR